MAETQTPKAEAPAPTVRIYNRSRRAYIHQIGKVKHVVSAATFSDVPADVAKLLLASYPTELVEAATAQKELGGQSAVIAEQKARIAELEAQLAALASKEPKGKKSAASDAV